MRNAYVQAKRSILRALRNPEAESYGARTIPRWDGGRDAYGKTYQPVWPKLAEFLLQNQCQPEAFIVAQIVGADLPPPTQLSNDAAVHRYRQQRVTNVNKLRNRLMSQAAIYDSLIALEKSIHPQQPLARHWRMALGSRELSPLFCYCVARQEPTLCDLAGPFWSDALSQYLEDPESYATAWAKILPEGMTQYVRELLKTRGVT